MAKAGTPGRKAVLGRIAAGLGGGYALSAACAWALSGLLPGPRIEAALGAGLVAYVLFVLAALWSFMPRRGWIVWLGTGGATVLFLLAGWIVSL